MTGAWTPELAGAVQHALEARGVSLGRIRPRWVGGGHSNETIVLVGERGSAVLRRPPAGPTPPGAHDVLREARIIAALHGGGVPVPRVLATFEAGELLAVPCFAMSFVPGVVIEERTPDALADGATKRAIADGLVDALAALHAFDWRGAGLRGRPEGANRRHLTSFGRLIAGPDGAPPPGFADLDAALAATVPADSDPRGALLHLDLRLGNVLVEPQPPGRIAAVLDWELAGVGDPLADLGTFLASWPDAATPLTPVQALAAAALEPGWPGRAVLAERYAFASGRDLADLDWHIAAAHRRLAVLYEYSHRRYVAGHGDPYYADPAQVPAFLRAAEAALGR